MTWQMLLLDANAVICLAIVGRLMFFRKSGETHRPGVAWMAYLLILAAGFTAFRIILGHYSYVDPGERSRHQSSCRAPR
ncbi:TPA: phage holin family protein [Enterobacter hormaechei]